MTEDVIERYETFNTKGCPYEIIFGNFNYQPITSKYYNILNDGNNDDNNNPGTPVYDTLYKIEQVEDEVVPNSERINNDIIIDDDERLSSDIEPPSLN